MKGTASFTIYHDTEMICRRFSKLIIVMMLHLSNVVWGLFLFNSFYQLWRGNRDTSTWEAAFNIAVPFDTSTLFGWYMFYVVQGFLAYSYSLNQPIIITFFMSCCLYTEALCKHFAVAFRRTDCRNQATNTAENNEFVDRSKENLLIREQFIAALKLHVKLIE